MAAGTGAAGPSNSTNDSELPKKRIIVCCDGTWNDSVNSDSPLTNVSRISRLISAVDIYGVQQIVSYHTGIGSGTSTLGNIRDGMSGRGISANIRDAYTFICHNYSNPEDEIVLIGFSRGAFTVRSIAAFMDDVGLLTKASLRYLSQLYHAWEEAGATPDLCTELVERGLLRKDIQIRICAVWDTVGSLGFPMPGSIPQRASKKLGFVNSKLSKNILIAIQALALNESCKHFMATVWAKGDAPGNLKQCWFLGAHSDVGGGNKDPGLANITLMWMIAQMEKHIGFDVNGLPDLAMGRLVRAEEKSKNSGIRVSLAALDALTISYSKAARTRESVRMAKVKSLTALDAVTVGYSEAARPGEVVQKAKGNSPAALDAVTVGHSEAARTREVVRKAKGAITNPMRGLFLLGGSLPRKPGQYLMNNQGPYRNSKTVPVATGETIHFSVRVLLGTGLRSCPTLSKYSTEIEPLDGETKVGWHLHSKSVSHAKIDLPEEQFSDSERRLLESWIREEHKQSDLVSISTSTWAQAGWSSTAAMYLSDIMSRLMSEAQFPTIKVINGAAEAHKTSAGREGLARVFSEA